ncbi:MAG: hypothetical protein AABX10_03600 [Nanoarchaeota archaeon]
MTEIDYIELNAVLIEKLPKVFDDLREKFIRMAKHYGLPRETAEDLSTDTALEVYSCLRDKKFVENGNGLMGYVSRAFDRNCIDELRRKNSKKRLKFECLDDGLVDPNAVDPINKLVEDENSEIVMREISKLSKNYQRVILSQLGELKEAYKSGAKRAKINRARDRLRERLSRVGVLEIEI